jgi:hypothetical protein
MTGDIPHTHADGERAHGSRFQQLRAARAGFPIIGS